MEDIGLVGQELNWNDGALRVPTCVRRRLLAPASVPAMSVLSPHWSGDGRAEVPHWSGNGRAQGPHWSDNGQACLPE
jgi:hypothetical protein